MSKIFDGYKSVTDWPASDFYQVLDTNHSLAEPCDVCTETTDNNEVGTCMSLLPGRCTEFYSRHIQTRRTPSTTL